MRGEPDHSDSIYYNNILFINHNYTNIIIYNNINIINEEYIIPFNAEVSNDLQAEDQDSDVVSANYDIYDVVDYEFAHDESTDNEFADDEFADDESTDDESTDDEADDEAVDDEADDDEADDEAVDDEAVVDDEPFVANYLNERCRNCGSLLDQDYLCRYLCDLSDDGLSDYES